MCIMYFVCYIVNFQLNVAFKSKNQCRIFVIGLFSLGSRENVWSRGFQYEIQCSDVLLTAVWR
jgi:hypothetical protein